MTFSKKKISIKLSFKRLCKFRIFFGGFALLEQSSQFKILNCPLPLYFFPSSVSSKILFSIPKKNSILFVLWAHCRTPPNVHGTSLPSVFLHLKPRSAIDLMFIAATTFYPYFLTRLLPISRFVHLLCFILCAINAKLR